MKCIGGKDYYDGVSAYDQTIVFDRRLAYTIDSPFLPAKSWALNRAITSLDSKNHINIQVIFCGKLYNGIAVGLDHSYKFYYDANEYFKDFEVIINKAKNNYWGYTPTEVSKQFSVENCEDFCITNKITVGVNHYFERDDYYGLSTTKHYRFVPVSREKNMILYNFNNLKSLDFAKVIEPYQASQEIERWISGVLTNAGNPMVNISDESKITKYGFDKKISFRHPTKIKV